MEKDITNYKNSESHLSSNENQNDQSDIDQAEKQKSNSEIEKKQFVENETINNHSPKKNLKGKGKSSPKNPRRQRKAKTGVNKDLQEEILNDLSKKEEITEKTVPLSKSLTNKNSSNSESNSQNLDSNLNSNKNVNSDNETGHIKKEDVVPENKGKGEAYILKLLIEKTSLEREAIKRRVNSNNFLLGEIVKARNGEYENNVTVGSKFIDIEKRKKMLEGRREINEKMRKELSKKVKPGSSKDKKLDETTITDEYFMELEIYDINKSNINKEEKEIQMELDFLIRERNSHLRELIRIRNQEFSRFSNFEILKDRYLILSLLGKSEFSQVNKAYDLLELRFVACKMHHVNQKWSKGKLENYINHAMDEVSILKTLDHKRIVKVYDVFHMGNDSFCTVLEYYESNDLEFYLKQKQCLPERDTKSLICQVINALWYLYDRIKPIIHYDLKPANILLSEYGEIKITEFGLSKICLDNSLDVKEIELSTFGSGTYWYLPPECFRIESNSKIVSSKVDVWSIGVIFYECLYGKKPFGHNMTQQEILFNNVIIEAKQIEFPTNPKATEAAKDFIRQCCTYDKELRPGINQINKNDYLKTKAQLNRSL